MSKKSSNFAAKYVQTMRKLFFILSVTLCVAGCKQSNITSVIAHSNPIMPVRMSSDTAHIVLTDYVPVLYGDTSLWKGLQWTTGNALECLNFIGTPQVVREMDIINRDRSIHTISFQNK